MTFRIEHVITGKREDCTQEQWDKINKLFPRTFRKVQSPVLQNLSDEAKKIISDASTDSEE